MPARTQSPARYRDLRVRRAQPTQPVGSGRLGRPLSSPRDGFGFKTLNPLCGARNQAGGARAAAGVSQPCTQILCYKVLIHDSVLYLGTLRDARHAPRAFAWDARVSTTAGRLGVHHTSGKLEGGPEVQTRVIRRADALVP